MTHKQLHQQAQQAINQQQWPQAQQALIRLLNADPSFADGYFLLGVIEAELGTYSKAVKLVEKAISLQANAEYCAHLAKCYAMMAESNKTYAAIEQAKAFGDSSALTLDTLGVALSRVGDHEQAIQYFSQAIAKKQQASFYYNLGSSQTFLGQFADARVSYERAIELEPLFYQAHSSLSHLGGVSEENNHIERLLSVSEQVQHPDAKLHLSHALAREYESTQQFDAAYHSLESAKSAKRSKLNYSFAQDQALFDGIKSLFDGKQFIDAQQSYSQAQPIFVVGMPRSGTTLIERVLTNNDIVKSAGELQEFGLALKKLANTPGRYILDAATLQVANSLDMAQLGQMYMDSLRNVIAPDQRFVDKMPLNVLYAGFIAKALPNAKIVCVIRNPMDTVWGNYKQLFSLNDPYYNYAYDQVTIAEYYAQFVALAEYWQGMFPEQFRIVSYDKFVQDPAQQGTKLVEFCDLQFTPEMLDITQNTSAVATASSVQVRSAINTRSLGQWRRVEPHLQAAKQRLQELGIMIPAN